MKSKLLLIVFFFSGSFLLSFCGEETSVLSQSICKRWCESYCYSKEYCDQLSQSAKSCSKNCLSNVTNEDQTERTDYCESNYDLFDLKDYSRLGQEDPDKASSEAKAFCSKLAGN